MSTANSTRKYLERLTKDELIHLIVTFAPSGFLKNINSQFATQKEALALLNKASGAIHNILTDDELLDEPNGFEQALVRQLETIRGLWAKLPVQIGELLIEIIGKVEEAFEDGYLYIEQYGEDDIYFESEAVNEYVIQFVKALPEDIQPDYIEQLYELLQNSGYSTFMSVEQQLAEISLA